MSKVHLALAQRKLMCGLCDRVMISEAMLTDEGVDKVVPAPRAVYQSVYQMTNC